MPLVDLKREEKLILNDKGIAGLLDSEGRDHRERAESFLRRLETAAFEIEGRHEIELVLRPASPKETPSS